MNGLVSGERLTSTPPNILVWKNYSIFDHKTFLQKVFGADFGADGSLWIDTASDHPIVKLALLWTITLKFEPWWLVNVQANFLSLEEAVQVR